MANGNPADQPSPAPRKVSNVIELKLNGHSVELAADQDPIWHWLSGLNIVERDLAPFTRVGQWNPPTFRPSGDRLKDLLAEHSMALIGGKACVVRWTKKVLPDGSMRDELDMIRRDDFRAFHSDKMIERRITTRKDGKSTTTIERKPATDQSFLDAKRYDGLVYVPHAAMEVRGAMNLWRGFGVEPKRGGWVRMKRHIHEVLASGNDEQAIYLLKWCAWAVQNPGRPAEVAIVLREKEGAGKGVFVQALLKMFGVHGQHISGRRSLVGNFNKHMMYSTLLYGDEVFWGGDIREVGELKRLITEPTLTIEPKAVDPFSMSNCLHIIMASNEDWVVPAGMDARRFAVMDVSPDRKGDGEYFDALWAEMNGGGTAAMLHDLLSMDLQGWHPRKDIPQTEALLKQKMESLKGVDKLVFMLASEGALPWVAKEARPNAVVTSGEQKGTGFLSWAKEADRTLRHMQGQKIRQALIDNYKCTPFSRDGDRGLDFPPLAELRAIFEQRLGHRVTWDNPDITDWQKPAARGRAWRPFVNG